MILVVGGTGTLGVQLVQRLIARGHAVRVLTRNPSAASGTARAGVEFVTGDLRSSADVARAVDSCSIVISAAHGFVGSGNPSPEAIDRDGNRTLFAAARAAGVAHLVLISVQGAAHDHPMSLHRAKFAAEEMLRASGLGFTILRPTAFMETWIGVIGGMLADKRQALVFGPGKNPINFVSVRDAAALVMLALDDATLRNAVVEIGGPENMGFVTLAERLIAARGSDARIKHIPLPALRIMSVLARPFAPAFARQAHAAVIMNTTNFSFEGNVRERFPSLPNTTLLEVLAAAGRPSRF
jgi:uncharacterized protein YbjT (DUF2867 family)